MHYPFFQGRRHPGRLRDARRAAFAIAVALSTVFPLKAQTYPNGLSTDSVDPRGDAEAIRQIRQRLNEVRNTQKRPTVGLVLSGGGARLKNAATLAERVFNLPCSVAVPRNFPELRPELAGPEWATALGALGLGVQSQLAKTPLHRSWLKRARNFFGFE